MSEIRVDRIVDSTGNSPVIYLDPSANEVRIGTGITFNTVTNQIILGDTVVGDISGNANFSGIVTASSFVGDGSGLTGIVGTGSGVEVRDNGSVVGTASTIDFGDNLTVTFSAGIMTVTGPSPSGSGSDFVRTSTGIHTLGNVGLGTTNPTTALTINGVLGFINSNVRIGDNTTGAAITTGTNNTFMGIGAGSSTTSGSDNTFIGNNAGYYNASGSGNNFFGPYAGYYITSGFGNNLIGNSAGFSNTSGSFNNFLGSQAGLSNTTGSFNNFIGRESGYYNTTGCSNNFLGFFAGNNNTTGCYNNFIGLDAGRNNTTGSNNNFFGSLAGYYNTTGCFNNFIGLDAGRNNTTGSRNTFIGYKAGYCNESGCYNNFLGYEAGVNNTIGEYNNFVGFRAGRCNVNGRYNNAFGQGAGYCNISGGSNVFLGSYTGIHTNRSLRLIFGTSGGVGGTAFDSPKNANKQFAVGINTTGTAEYWLVGDENFNIGIGTTNPTTKLQVGGTITATAFVGDGSGLTNLPAGPAGTSDFVRTSAGIHTLGNVGVGTTNPKVKLQIDGILGFGTFNDGGYAATNIRIGDNTTGVNLTSGGHNIFMGIGAGNSTTTGYYNNFFGSLSGYNNTTGGSNNFFGSESGFNNTEGLNNNFLGYFAGYENTIGSENNFFGRFAGISNTTGSYNNFLGYFAGGCNTTGSYNNFFGNSAGYCNTTGCYNNFFGNSAGYSNTTGGCNNFLGYFAGGANTTGGCNNFIGYYAGYYNATGTHNTFLGAFSGTSTSASNKIILGRGGSFNQLFDSPDTTKDTQFAVGIRTDANPAEYWLVGNENFNIGIGTTNPSEKLSVTGNIALNQTTIYGSVQASTASTSVTGIHSGLSTSVYRSVEYTIQATSGTNYQAIKILAIHDGTTAYDTQYGNIYNTEVATFDVDISAGNVRLVAAATSTSTTNYTVNFIATKI